MLKKLVASGAAFALLSLFACSSDDGDSPKPKNSSSSTVSGISSSEEGGGSSSSITTPEKVTEEKLIYNYRAVSPLFKTWGYGYALRNNDPEDLTPFWDCETEAQDAIPDPACELDKTNAILQNPLTNRYSALHYNVEKERIVGLEKGLWLDRYKLSAEGDQAAVGIDAVDDSKVNHISTLAGVVEFSYGYIGAAHAFRAVTDVDSDFWFVRVPASLTDTVPRYTIDVSDMEGAGSFAANEAEGKDETPFDISRVTKFLWAVEYDAETPANNTGSLLIGTGSSNGYFRAKVEVE